MIRKNGTRSVESTEENRDEIASSLSRRSLLKKSTAVGIIGMGGLSLTEKASASETDTAASESTTAETGITDSGPAAMSSETSAVNSDSVHTAAAGCGLPGVSFVPGGAQIDISVAGRGHLAANAYTYADCILDASYYLDETCGRTRAGVAARIAAHCATWWQSVVNIGCGGD